MRQSTWSTRQVETVTGSRASMLSAMTSRIGMFDAATATLAFASTRTAIPFSDPVQRDAAAVYVRAALPRA